MGKKWLPEITNRFTNDVVREIKNWSLEGTVPWNWNSILCMENGYRINIHGQVLWENNIPLTQVFRRWNRSPFAVITLHKKRPDGKLVPTQRDLRIDNLMEQYFWPHIEWYSEMKNDRSKSYIVVPKVVSKDGKWTDMSLKNLKYTIEEEYNLNWTKKWLLIALLPFFHNAKSDDELAKLLHVSRGWISRVKTELKEQGRMGNSTLNDLVISHKTYKIYEALLVCDWLKSNLDIAKELWPKMNFDLSTDKDALTDKVSRVRRKLYDKWLIQKYNTYQQKVNIADVRQALEQALITNRALEKWERKTHAEIAQLFGLEKQQVDNYSRQITQKNMEE